MRWRTLAFALALAAVAIPSAAQPPKEPIGRFAADVRLTSTGLPGDPGWTPLVPNGTLVPSRGLGVEIGAQAYVLRSRRMALGLGASWLRGSASTAPPTAEDAATPPPPLPDMTTRLTALVPQVSLNFGHALGWSYISGGLGRAKVESEASLAGPPPLAAALDSGWVGTIHYGGGARWFINDRVGVGFDLRWHRLSSVAATSTHPGAPRASLFMAGAGLVLK